MSPTNIKILHVIAGDLNGGAARGAFWLHQAMDNQEGIESRLLISDESSLADDKYIYSLSKNKKSKCYLFLLRSLEQLLMRCYKNRKPGFFSSGIFGFNLNKISLVEWADVIHLHWINSSFIDTSKLKYINKPIIWTLRDMWALTGGCHYSLDCNKYKTGCNQCPLLGSTTNKDLSYRMSQKKKQHFNHPALHIVTISKWLNKEATSSFIFNNAHVSTIHNSINTKNFKPIKKQIAREILQLPLDKKLILAGAQDITHEYKGFDLFVNSLSNIDFSDKHLILFGKNTTHPVLENIPTTHLGFLHDTYSLRLMYSAADVFVAPSKQEAFGKTVAESISCNTPSVCFADTGAAEIVSHCHTGYIAQKHSSEDLTNGVNWCLENPIEDSDTLHNSIKDNFDTIKAASKYTELYKEAINTFNSQSRE